MVFAYGVVTRPEYAPGVELNCVRCGRIAWLGLGNAIVDGVPGREPTITVGRYWRPGGSWRCSACHHLVVRPSPMQVAIDDAVAQWIRARGG